MRNETIIQFTGSKVSHMPHPFNEGTLCGREFRGAAWNTGHYEQYAEVTCKNCLHTIPKVTWNRFLWLYRYTTPASGRKVYVHPLPNPESIEDVLIGDEYGHWFPSKDEQISGILAVWSEFWQRWTVYYSEES